MATTPVPNPPPPPKGSGGDNNAMTTMTQSIGPPKNDSSNIISATSESLAKGDGASSVIDDNEKAAADRDNNGGIFRLLDTDTRLKIFQYLTWQDLASAAPSSKAFRDDCYHPSVARDEVRQLTVRFQACSASLFRKLVELQDAGKFNHCSRLKIVWRGTCLDDPSQIFLIDDVMLTQVTDVELAFEGDVPYDNVPEGRHRQDATDTNAESRMLITVGRLLPNLRSLTVPSSHGTDRISTKAPFYLSVGQLASTVGHRCFDSIVLRGQSASTHLRERNMGSPLWTRSIDLDDCTFDLTTSDPLNAVSSQELFAESDENDDNGNGDNRCIFQLYATSLERVSIRNARYYTEVTVDDGNGMTTPLIVLELPQSALIKFVRRATNLQWFRSDLTPDNVAMLQRERPDVTFVS